MFEEILNSLQDDPQPFLQLFLRIPSYYLLQVTTQKRRLYSKPPSGLCYYLLLDLKFCWILSSISV